MLFGRSLLPLLLVLVSWPALALAQSNTDQKCDATNSSAASWTDKQRLAHVLSTHPRVNAAPQPISSNNNNSNSNNNSNIVATPSQSDSGRLAEVLALHPRVDVAHDSELPVPHARINIGQEILESQGHVVEVCSESFLLSRLGDKRSWLGACQVCHALNLTLVSLDTASKQSCLAEYFADHDGSRYKFWSSGRYVNDTFVWTASNQTFGNFTSWAPGQPDFRNDNQLCVLASFKQPSDYSATLWSDENCNSLERYICE